MTNCKKCKRICIECRYCAKGTVFYYPSQPSCHKKGKETLNCVTGETYTEYPLCQDKNMDGLCKDFKPLVSKTIDKDLEALEHEFHSSSLTTKLIEILRKRLKNDNNDRRDLIELINRYKYDRGDDYGYDYCEEESQVLSKACEILRKEECK